MLTAVVDKIAAYLRHDISLGELVRWTEEAMLDEDFAEQDVGVIADAVGRLGVADVRAFGLTWEDCEQLLRQLGYEARIDIVARVKGQSARLLGILGFAILQLL